MLYKVKRVNGMFAIYEVQTDQIVMLDKDEKNARYVARKWNRGSGFAGWTPSFFVKNILQSQMKTA